VCVCVFMAEQRTNGALGQCINVSLENTQNNKERKRLVEPLGPNVSVNVNK
jgi:hypothetical protein